MLDLLRICDYEGIAVFWRSLDPFEHKVMGMYFLSPGGRPVIALDTSIMQNIPRVRSILAEELFHHYATPGVEHLNFGPARSLSCLVRSKAVCDAANYLIPTEELALAAKDGLIKCEQLAQHFHVEEYIVWCKLAILRRDVREQDKFRAIAEDAMKRLLCVKHGQKAG